MPYFYIFFPWLESDRTASQSSDVQVNSSDSHRQEFDTHLQKCRCDSVNVDRTLFHNPLLTAVLQSIQESPRCLLRCFRLSLSLVWPNWPLTWWLHGAMGKTSSRWKLWQCIDEPADLTGPQLTFYFLCTCQLSFYSCSFHHPQHKTMHTYGPDKEGSH